MHTYPINLPKELVAEVLHRVLPVTSDGLGFAGCSIPVGCSVQFFLGSLTASLFLSFLPPLTPLLPHLVYASPMKRQS